MIGPRTEDDRGVSIAVTHVLTIAITTILIATLLTSASGLLDSETDRSAESSLETVGERLAGEIANVDQIAEDDEVTLTVEQPRTVANSGYTVALLEASSCADAPLLDGGTDCLRLSGNGVDVVVHVPIKTDADLDGGSSAPGGTIEIVYDDDEDEISLERAN